MVGKGDSYDCRMVIAQLLAKIYNRQRRQLRLPHSKHGTVIVLCCSRVNLTRMIIHHWSAYELSIVPTYNNVWLGLDITAPMIIIIG